MPRILPDSPTWCESPLTPLLGDNDHLFLEEESDFLIPDVFTIDTNFDPGHADNMKVTYSREDEALRFQFTEAQRKLAENAVNPTDLPDLKIKVGDLIISLNILTLCFFFLQLQNQLESGIRKDSDDYIKVTSDLLKGYVSFTLFISHMKLTLKSLEKS